MITPRPYLSFSQMTLFEMSPQRFIERYIQDREQYVSKNMKYGSLMADGLESEEATGDPLLDIVMAQIPKLERMDMAIEDPRGPEVAFRGDKTAKIPVLRDGKVKIPILALPDTASADFRAFKEYKQSVRKWTQKMANDSGQITFYATAIWIAKGFVPQDIELVDVEVEYKDDGSMQPTGNIYRFPTKRTIIDIIKMTRRMKNAWAGITALCERELL
jgi:hypothetical protein